MNGEMTRLPNQKGLQRKYTEFNKEYFNNELPDAKHVRIEWSVRMTRNAGVCIPGTRTIRISWHYANRHRDWEGVLLHEMIHLKVPNHSKEFYRELDRINFLGGQVSRYSKGKAKKARYIYECVDCGRKSESDKKLDPKKWRCRCRGKLKCYDREQSEERKVAQDEKNKES